MRAILDIAIHDHDGPVTLAEISQRQEISRKYLGQIINQLLAADILESRRGPHGGYLLARPPGEIRLGEIVRALEGSVAPVRCVDNPDICDRNPACVTRQVWFEVKKSVEAVVDDVTVADLMERERGMSTPTG